MKVREWIEAMQDENPDAEVQFIVGYKGRDKQVPIFEAMEIVSSDNDVVTIA
jgi:hypothetical protein